MGEAQDVWNSLPASLEIMRVVRRCNVVVKCRAAVTMSPIEMYMWLEVLYYVICSKNEQKPRKSVVVWYLHTNVRVLQTIIKALFEI